MKGNIGEWSEAYTFLKLLADGKIHAADSKLNTIHDSFYEILQIVRGSGPEQLNYKRNGKIKVVDSTGKELHEIEIKEFQSKATELLKKMQSSSSYTFECNDIGAFLNSI